MNIKLRRCACWLMTALALTTHAAEKAMKMDTTPQLTRIKIATIGAPDVNEIARLYGRWLDYDVASKGTVSETLAASWGAPASAGRPYVMLMPASGEDVFIRAVETDPVKNYRAMTTLGWNAIEIIVDDVYATRKKLEAAPFKIIGEPHSLGGQFASIHAMQFLGPAQEVVYLTMETGDRAKSTLPIPKVPIDRPFIMVLAGHDLEVLVSFYASRFGLSRIPIFPAQLDLVREAQALPEGHEFTMSLLRGAERGNNIELDGYPISAQHRETAPGQLPPGVAMTTFSVPDLDALELDFIQPPQMLYGTLRAATFVGPAGELTELLEEPVDRAGTASE